MESRVAKQPVTIPSGVSIDINGTILTVSGPNGKIGFDLTAEVEAKIEENLLLFKVADGARSAAMAGTARSLAANNVIGVTEGFVKNLKLVGIGYKSALKGRDLNLEIGLSHNVLYKAASDITFEVIKATTVIVKGIDKQRVGQVAAEIRALRPPEPYKGKGIRYENEIVILKEVDKK